MRLVQKPGSNIRFQLVLYFKRSNEYHLKFLEFPQWKAYNCKLFDSIDNEPLLCHKIVGRIITFCHRIKFNTIVSENGEKYMRQKQLTMTYN